MLYEYHYIIITLIFMHSNATLKHFQSSHFRR